MVFRLLATSTRCTRPSGKLSLTTTTSWLSRAPLPRSSTRQVKSQAQHWHNQCFAVCTGFFNSRSLSYFENLTRSKLPVFVIIERRGIKFAGYKKILQVVSSGAISVTCSATRCACSWWRVPSPSSLGRFTSLSTEQRLIIFGKDD